MINFLNIQSSGISSAKDFGLCHDETKPFSYLDESNNENWLAVIKNDDESEVRFIGVKGCPELQEKGCEDLNLCNGILIYPNNVVFSGLRYPYIDDSNWINDGIDQLNNTITLFRASNNIEDQQQVAYLSNNRSPNFPTIITTEKNIFALKMAVQLFIDPIIVI